LTFTATDAFGAAIAQQIGRPMSGGPFVNVNLITPGTLYGGAPLFADRNRQIDLSLKKIIRISGQRLTAGLDIYNVANSDTVLFYKHDVRAKCRRLANAAGVNGTRGSCA
jgi:hypothetical protein